MAGSTLVTKICDKTKRTARASQVGHYRKPREACWRGRGEIGPGGGVAARCNFGRGQSGGPWKHPPRMSTGPSKPGLGQRPD